MGGHAIQRLMMKPLRPGPNLARFIEPSPGAVLKPGSEKSYEAVDFTRVPMNYTDDPVLALPKQYDHHWMVRDKTCIVPIVPEKWDFYNYNCIQDTPVSKRKGAFSTLAVLALFIYVFVERKAFCEKVGYDRINVETYTLIK